MKKIKLTNGDYAIVDNNDYLFLNSYTWTCLQSKGNRTKYAQSRMGIKNESMIYMHRFILDAKKNQIIDHKNRNGLDNRRKNLRFCTASENQWNKSLYSKNVSGYTGVSWHKNGEKWQARISAHNKTYFLGLFTDKKEAVLAYKNKSKELHKFQNS
jgi:hypothetical protein